PPETEEASIHKARSRRGLGFCFRARAEGGQGISAPTPHRSHTLTIMSTTSGQEARPSPPGNRKLATDLGLPSVIPKGEASIHKARSRCERVFSFFARRRSKLRAGSKRKNPAIA